LRIEDFDYALPSELIAQEPLTKRDQARLMVISRQSGTIVHRRFSDLVEYVDSGDALVINNTRVNEASFSCIKDSTGARIDVLLTSRRSSTVFEALVKNLKRLHTGERCAVTESLSLKLAARTPSGGALVEFSSDPYLDGGFRSIVRVQIPPYIRRFPDDAESYQTVYASVPGSVAAPTAGLHFTEELLGQIADRGGQVVQITLDVGPGTFQPVREERIEEHVMHAERYTLPPETASAINAARSGGHGVVAVGTTVARTLETCVDKDGVVHPGSGETGIYIYPPYAFRSFDHLVTNFHLPKSTLLMLVGAFMTMDLMKKAYSTAVEERYRFFSFGDAMLIL
jgi:S-adenosylmethionine:tRNA ribosyltransferase-isomerase